MIDIGYVRGVPLSIALAALLLVSENHFVVGHHRERIVPAAQRFVVAIVVVRCVDDGVAERVGDGGGEGEANRGGAVGGIGELQGCGDV